MLHACNLRFDVTRNFRKILIFWCEINKALCMGWVVQGAWPGLRSAAATASISATGTQWHDAAFCRAQCGRVTPSCRCFVGPSCCGRASRSASPALERFLAVSVRA